MDDNSSDMGSLACESAASSAGEATPHAGEASSQFEYFPKLPIEIRLKIWEMKYQESPIVDLWAAPCGGEYGEKFFSSKSLDNAWQYSSHSLPPAILHTSREHGQLDFNITLWNSRLMGL